MPCKGKLSVVGALVVKTAKVRVVGIAIMQPNQVPNAVQEADVAGRAELVGQYSSLILHLHT